MALGFLLAVFFAGRVCFLSGPHDPRHCGNQVRTRSPLGLPCRHENASRPKLNPGLEKLSATIQVETLKASVAALK